MSESKSYQDEFIERESDAVYSAMNLSETLRVDLSKKDAAVAIYLQELRAAFIIAMQVLEGCDPADLNSIIKAQADMRAYRRFFTWVSSTMQEGDMAWSRHQEEAMTADEIDPDDGSDMPEGAVPFAPDRG